MPFAYFDRLSKAQQAIYLRSDAIHAVALPDAADLAPLLEGLAAALSEDHLTSVRVHTSRLCRAMTERLGVPPVTAEVLAVRPRSEEYELQGLYTPQEGRRQARLQVWMRTAVRSRPVAFRTFLRTVLHELCHHLDYTLFELEETFHTEGFFKRESSLFHQLVPKARPERGT